MEDLLLNNLSFIIRSYSEFKSTESISNLSIYLIMSIILLFILII